MEQIPALLGPMGIATHLCRSGEEAEDLARRMPIHIAIVDLEMPLRNDGTTTPGGSRVLELMRRLDQPPPVVVIRPRQATDRESARSLGQALQHGAFAVLDRPLRLEAMLETMRRVLARHYADCWPGDAT